MEGLTLHYYLKVFSAFIIIILSISFFYIFYVFNKKITINNNQFNIENGETIEEVITKNINNFSFIDLKIIKIYLKISNIINNNFIHYGDFKIKDKSSLLQFIEIISKPSNVLNKITIVEGWSQKQLNSELSKYFNDFYPIPYQNIIADTYFIQNNTSFQSFLEKLKKVKFNYFKLHNDKEIFNQFNENQIMIIGSLLEKEGLDKEDKKKISSVIYNRLNINMKLQIDATVIFSLTNGNYELGRKLLVSDLRINHPYNTYLYHGLPPQPISYVGKKTLDILYENYKTDFLFYFFDNSLNRHIFSKNFTDHKEKLNEYRNKK